MLKFSPANTKTRKLAERPEAMAHFGRKPKIYGFTLPSGYTCPGALDCLSKADRNTGKLTDGPESQYRCFMAQLESGFKSLRNMAWANFDQLREWKQNPIMMASLISEGLPIDADIIRVHVGGDFFNADYMLAWAIVAAQNPNVIFYSYTKSLNYWVELSSLPPNFKLVASYGGRRDALISMLGLRAAHVVFSEAEAAGYGLEIDYDESHHVFGTGDFALLLHGSQPKGTPAATALKAIKEVARVSIPVML